MSEQTTPTGKLQDAVYQVFGMTIGASIAVYAASAPLAARLALVRALLDEAEKAQRKGHLALAGMVPVTLYPLEPTMTDIVERLRETLTGEDTDEAMWQRIVSERREAADVIVALRVKLHRERSKRGHAIAVREALANGR